MKNKPDSSENKKHIYVTKTFLPEYEEFSSRCKDIFQSVHLTNNGKYVRELEQRLSLYLGVKHLLTCCNGTMALMLALHGAGLAGKKVALSPYTYVATLSSLLWLGCTPVFIDVEPDTLTLSPQLLEKRLQAEPDIAAVLPVHIYGLACDLENLDLICQKHKIPLIYDAAQAFGSRYKGKSLLDYGDYSICSFHATKIFHTAEGGCVVSHKDEDNHAVALARAFGHINDDHFTLGINGKMSEFHAALGLSVLDNIEAELMRHKAAHLKYDQDLSGLPLTRPGVREGLEWNHSYYPVLLPNEAARNRVEQALITKNIFPRRYFYPSLNTLPYVNADLQNSCPIAEDASKRVLCLPIFGDIQDEDLERISGIIRNVLNETD